MLQWGSIAFRDPEDPAPLLEALKGISEYDWIFFSSPRAVEAVVCRIPPPGGRVRTAAVGPSTALALKEAGWPVHRVGEEATGAGMVEAFRKAGDAPGARVFFPASARARRVFPEGMEALGARVEEVTAYRLMNLPLDREAIGGALRSGDVQAVTFASPSALEGLRAGVGEETFLCLARELPCAAMGTTTAGALGGVGWERIVVAQEPTLEGLALAGIRAAGLIPPGGM